MAKRQLPDITYLTLDSTADIHAVAVAPVEIGAMSSLQILHTHLGDENKGRAAFDVALLLVDSPLGDALETIALPEPPSDEHLVTNAYMSLLELVDRNLPHVNPPPIDAQDLRHVRKLFKKLKRNADGYVSHHRLAVVH